MKDETKNCQNCKKEFVIKSDDFGFYEKIKVPPPTFCPECRVQRRLSWRNDLSFYNRSCDLCGKKIISLYHKDKPLTVYCNKCWWSDKWDPKNYEKDIDFSRPFFEQFRELQDKVPLLALFNDNDVGSVNCEYAQNVTFAKNCYMEFVSWFVEDCMYTFSCGGPETRDVVDSFGIFSYSQIIYDSIWLKNTPTTKNIVTLSLKLIMHRIDLRLSTVKNVISKKFIKYEKYAKVTKTTKIFADFRKFSNNFSIVI